MKSKICWHLGCVLLMMFVMAGCSKSPQSEEQKENQSVAQSVESLSSDESEKSLVGSGQVSQGAFTIQVVSYHDLSRAEEMVEKLKAEGYQAYVTPEDLEKQGRWYRVRVGNFKTKEEAELQLLKLKDKFSDCFIRRR
ncbi:MAG: SPOR domain-containing protein [Candidatus Omnitrophota bacterium]